MSIVSAKEMLLKATREGYAVGAFNVTNIIQMEGVVKAAVNKRAPLIIQTSVTPAKFLGPNVFVAVYRALAETVPIPICLHLDHCTDIALCQECARAGYTNIMIDASRHPFAENIRQTKLMVEYCHSLGDITVEGELGTVAGVEDQVKVVEDEAALAQPDEAVEFVGETGVDLFAPAIGTAHGVYKTRTPRLEYDLLRTIANRLNGETPRVPLVIHGGTGLGPDVIRKLIALGGSKFNVSTDLKHTLVDSTFDYISAHRQEYDPGKVDESAQQAIMARVESWIDVLGCAGKA